MRKWYIVVTVGMALQACATIDQFGNRVGDGNRNSQDALNEETLLNVLRANKLLYILFLSVFWILLRIAQTRSRHLFLLGFVPPIAWLVFAKTTGLLFFVGLSYMLFRCAHVEWEIINAKSK